MERRMLAKDEEVSTEDVEVRREDQEKINKFSSLHQREAAMEADLKQKQDKEDLEEISSELELADEDEKIPYKIGDSFFSLPVEQVQDLLTKSSEQIEQEVEKLESKLSGLRDEMQELKVALYSRFGRSINLEV
ncbi:Prefoldin, subunit 4 [Microthyrium microscopicum]|uniref:Prefoldin subunit 4 n=1 Tax=Microthyrium microscopicum TaxID=703497 RepID=A0A6A6U2A4_9PEZI|nr:Prefoldin, subunit 4 [Microthyrium microscopicum]